MGPTRTWSRSTWPPTATSALCLDLKSARGRDPEDMQGAGVHHNSGRQRSSGWGWVTRPEEDQSVDHLLYSLGYAQGPYTSPLRRSRAGRSGAIPETGSMAARQVHAEPDRRQDDRPSSASPCWARSTTASVRARADDRSADAEHGSFWLTEHLFGATWTPERGSMGYDRIINKYRHPFPTRTAISALPYTDAHWVVLRLAGPRSREGEEVHRQV